MDVTAEQKTRTIQELHFEFLNGSNFSPTLEPALGDGVIETPTEFVVTYAPKPLVPGSVEETHIVYKSHVIYYSSRERDVIVLDPKANPVAQRVAELQAKQPKQAAPPTTQS